MSGAPEDEVQAAAARFLEQLKPEQLTRISRSGFALARKAGGHDAVGQPSVEETIALGDARIRKAVSIWIMVLFAVVNFFTLGLIVWLAFGDRHELKLHLIGAKDRLVNAEVVISARRHHGAARHHRRHHGALHIQDPRLTKPPRKRRSAEIQTVGRPLAGLITCWRKVRAPRKHGAG